MKAEQRAKEIVDQCIRLIKSGATRGDVMTYLFSEDLPYGSVARTMNSISRLPSAKKHWRTES